MKEGAGEDPFAEDEGSDAGEPPETGEATADQAGTAGQQQDSGRMRIPYKLRRDGVQDGRSRVPLFLQEETKRGEREAQRELERRFDDSVSLTDLREALVMVGLEHMDEVEGQLEEWGYGMTFED